MTPNPLLSQPTGAGVDIPARLSKSKHLFWKFKFETLRPGVGVLNLEAIRFCGHFLLDQRKKKVVCREKMVPPVREDNSPERSTHHPVIKALSSCCHLPPPKKKKFPEIALLLYDKMSFFAENKFELLNCR